MSQTYIEVQNICQSICRIQIFGKSNIEIEYIYTYCRKIKFLFSDHERAVLSVEVFSNFVFQEQVWVLGKHLIFTAISLRDNYAKVSNLLESLSAVVLLFELVHTVNSFPLAKWKIQNLCTG